MGQTTYDATLMADAVYQAALMHLRDTNVMLGLVTVFNDKQGLIPRTGSRWNSLAYRQIATTDDVTPQEYSRDALATLTPAIYGASVFVADEDQNTDTEDILANAAEEFGAGMAQHMEVNLLSHFSSLTGGTVGTSGSAISWPYFFAMKDRLHVASKGRGQKIMVLHTYQWGKLAQAAALASVNIVQPQMVDRQLVTAYGLRQVDDVLIYPTSNITISSNNAYAGMYTMEALAADIRTGFNVRPQRDESRGGGGLELNAGATYAHGVWDASQGIQGLFACTVPTGT